MGKNFDTEKFLVGKLANRVAVELIYKKYVSIGQSSRSRTHMHKHVSIGQSSPANSNNC